MSNLFVPDQVPAKSCTMLSQLILLEEPLYKKNIYRLDNLGKMSAVNGYSDGMCRKTLYNLVKNPLAIFLYPSPSPTLCHAI